ncbi:MAG: hypothetical protein MN733_40245, partial [Nitrososphaera sp.]|nr:hypothetical protein [Nitrososphaera sp.]
MSNRTIRLHDVMRQYLVQKIGADLPKLHAHFLETYHPLSHAKWADLPTDEPYLWRNLAYHLAHSGRSEELHRLLLDYDWLANKLAVCEVNALLADYDFFSEDRELRVVQSALRLSANQLTQDHNQLAPHFLGRLLNYDLPNIQNLLKQAVDLHKQAVAYQKIFWLRPLTASLTPPEGPILFTLEGYIRILGVAITLNGKLIVAASRDGTIKVLDLMTGQVLRTLTGHNDGVISGAITSDGQLAISASVDNTLKVWDLATGHELRTLKGHADAVDSVMITPNGQCAVSASSDKTLKVWDLITGQELRTLKGHDSRVTSVALTPNGQCAVSASEDTTLKVWDLATGQELRTLKGHDRGVTSVAITPDGQHVISASEDSTLKVWDLSTGQQLQTLKGHSYTVTCVALTPDGRLAISTSHDN